MFLSNFCVKAISKLCSLLSSLEIMSLGLDLAVSVTVC